MRSGELKRRAKPGFKRLKTDGGWLPRGALPAELDVDTSNVSLVLFRWVMEFCKLREPGLGLLIIQFAAWRDPLDLFLSSEHVIKGAELYVSRNVFKTEFRRFCKANHLTSVSYSVSTVKPRVTQLLKSHHASIQYDLRDDPALPEASPIASDRLIRRHWIVGVKLRS